LNVDAADDKRDAGKTGLGAGVAQSLIFSML